MKLLGLAGNIAWVKAHQDNSCNPDDLTLQAQLSCLVDAGAQSFLSQNSSEWTPTFNSLSFTIKNVQLIVNGETATRSPISLLLTSYNNNDLCKFIRKNTGLN
eukprot:10401503-Ditylum_brightwellii.AAC.2